MLISVLLIICLLYEFHKLLKFNLFFRLKKITSDYYNQITERKHSVAHKEIVKVSFIDFFYLIVIFISLFSFNAYFAFVLIILSVTQSFVFKTIKNNTIRKVYVVFDGTLSIVLLSLAIINIYFFQVNGIELVKNLINLI